MLGAAEEVEHDVAVGVVADLRPVGRGQARGRAAGGRPPGRGAPPRAAARSPAIGGPNGSGRPCSAMNRSAVRMISSERASHSAEVSPQAVMPWPPRIAPIASGCVAPDLGHVQAELEAGPAPVDPGHPIAEAARGSGPRRRRRVASAIPESGWRWSTWSALDEAVHRGVDRRRGAAAAVEAVVERGDHLVLALDARDRRRPGRAGGRAAGRRGPASVSVPRSPPEPLTHSSSTGVPVTGSMPVPLAEVLPPA